MLNDTKNGSKQPIDISVYDVMKCFDSLWVEECINDMFDAGVQNDKLNVLYMLNQNAQVAVKNSSGLTQRETISNIIMQGTVWGGIFCTTTMDKLGKIKYDNPELLYNYKNSVGIPALEMVDDILYIQKCGVDSVKSNQIVNTFIENKKLELGKDKCHKIHCGRKSDLCPDLKVHDEKMQNSVEEKYLGDQIHQSAKNVKTLSKRRAKGYGILSDIIFIIEAIPNGKERLKLVWSLGSPGFSTPLY